MPGGSTEAAAWLAARSSSDVNSLALWRASQLGAELRVRFDSRYPSGPNGESLPSYQVAVGCDLNGTEAACRAAAKALLGFMTPAPARTIEGWLSELSVIVARRPSEEFSEELRLTAYASRLRSYPADVAREALLVRTWQFWPTWAELQQACDRLAAPRRHMLAALARGPEPEPEVREPLTPEARERLARETAECLAELAAKEAPAKERIPHWSETAAPDDPRFAELRRARAASQRCPRPEEPA